MVFKNLCVLELWTKKTLAMKELKETLTPTSVIIVIIITSLTIVVVLSVILAVIVALTPGQVWLTCKKIVTTSFEIQ